MTLDVIASLYLSASWCKLACALYYHVSEQERLQSPPNGLDFEEAFQRNARSICARKKSGIKSTGGDM